MPLSPTEIDQRLIGLNGWSRGEQGIEKLYEFANFREAFSFLVRVAFEAEQRDHHPVIENVYNKVTLTLWTHSEGGVTDKDLDLARAIESFNWR